MKKIIALNLFVLALVACDKVKHPDQRPPAVYNCVDPLTQVVNTNTASSNYRKVLLEDYTGHTCPNCPRAAEAAEALIATYQTSLVVIANHVSTTFAAPKTTIYKEDFRNVTSEEWDNVQYFGMSNAGLPKGMVNRQTPFAQNHAAWSSLVPAALSKPQSAKLDIVSHYDKNSHYLNVSVKTTFKSAWANSVKLIVVLTQDSIIGNQKDGDPPAGIAAAADDPSRLLYYRFDHVVVNAINGTWGQLVKAAPLANDTITIQNSCYLVDKCFTVAKDVCLNDKYVSIVAFVYDAKTYEVLQVEKLAIIPKNKPL